MKPLRPQDIARQAVGSRCACRSKTLHTFISGPCRATPEESVISQSGLVWFISCGRCFRWRRVARPEEVDAVVS